jgi:hypothetical protein
MLMFVYWRNTDGKRVMAKLNGLQVVPRIGDTIHIADDTFTGIVVKSLGFSFANGNFTHVLIEGECIYTQPKE